jgi:hypothetical protein
MFKKKKRVSILQVLLEPRKYSSDMPTTSEYNKMVIYELDTKEWGNFSLQRN